PFTRGSRNSNRIVSLASSRTASETRARRWVFISYRRRRRVGRSFEAHERRAVGLENSTRPATTCVFIFPFRNRGTLPPDDRGAPRQYVAASSERDSSRCRPLRTRGPRAGDYPGTPLPPRRR